MRFRRRPSGRRPVLAQRTRFIALWPKSSGTCRAIETHCVYQSAEGVLTVKANVASIDNYDMPHQGLGNQTPSEVYRPRGRKRPATAI